ncbi:MAG: hypothetical protein RJA99_4133 [Pseudomonadota bacterium]|jgi:hypothetical protein
MAIGMPGSIRPRPATDRRRCRQATGLAGSSDTAAMQDLPRPLPRHGAMAVGTEVAEPPGRGASRRGERSMDTDRRRRSAPDRRSEHDVDGDPDDPSQPTGRRPADERIRDDLRQCLARDERLDGGDVSVDVKDGRVTLTGTVADRPAKHAIESMVDRCQGVTDIDDRLKVMRGPEPSGPPRPHASVPQDSPSARDEAQGRTSRPTRDGSGDYG